MEMETEDLGLMHIQTWSCVYYKPIEQCTQPGFQSTLLACHELQAGLGAKRTGKNSLNFRMVPSMTCSQKPGWKEIGDYGVINILLLPFIVLCHGRSSEVKTQEHGKTCQVTEEISKETWFRRDEKNNPQLSQNEFCNFSGTPGSQKKIFRNGQIM